MIWQNNEFKKIDKMFTKIVNLSVNNWIDIEHERFQECFTNNICSLASHLMKYEFKIPLIRMCVEHWKYILVAIRRFIYRLSVAMSSRLYWKISTWYVYTFKKNVSLLLFLPTIAGSDENAQIGYQLATRLFLQTWLATTTSTLQLTASLVDAPIHASYITIHTVPSHTLPLEAVRFCLHGIIMKRKNLHFRLERFDKWEYVKQQTETGGRGAVANEYKARVHQLLAFSSCR